MGVGQFCIGGDIRPLEHAKEKIDRWREHYNQVRPHSTLGYLPPARFAAQAADKQDGGESAGKQTGLDFDIGFFFRQDGCQCQKGGDGSGENGKARQTLFQGPSDRDQNRRGDNRRHRGGV